MLCTSCGTDNREGAKFCDVCGTPLPLSCPACGTANRPGAQFCNECGASLTGQQSVPRPMQEVPIPPTPTAQPTQVASPSVASHTSAAERRQLTVMFCDLVDSTKLSSQLDPEEYRELVRAYQSACTEVITRFDGHIAQLLGDGLLVYFGYPQAHEDDAHRAVRTGLGILSAMGDLRRLYNKPKVSNSLSVWVSIRDWSLSVTWAKQDAKNSWHLGKCPILLHASKDCAASNTIAISEATYRLVQGYFTVKHWGDRPSEG